MKPIEVGFDGNFKIIGNICNFVNIRLKPTKSQLKDWPTENLCDTLVWSCTDPESPELLYVNKEGKLYSVYFKPIGDS